MKKEKKSGEPERFEDYLQELEKIVDALEEGELDLETSLKKYEGGIKALKRCYEILDEMEKRIEILTKDKDGKLQTAPFNPKRTKSQEELSDDANDD